MLWGWNGDKAQLLTSKNGSFKTESEKCSNRDFPRRNYLNPTVKSEDFTNAEAFTLALFWARHETQGHSSLKSHMKT